MPAKRYYRLYDLIIQKYGAEKFAVGCLITAQWINTIKPYPPVTPVEIESICNTKYATDRIGFVEAEKLRQLFGLQTTDELINS